MSNEQQQQFGVMPMSPLGLLQQAKTMTMDYGQSIQDTWLEQQKETAALYGGLSLDGSDSGEPGLVELYMSMAVEAADKQAHATRIEAYTSFAQAGISAGQMIGMGVASPDSSLTKEQENVPELKKTFASSEGALQAAEDGALQESDAEANQRVQSCLDRKSTDAREDILKKGNGEKYKELTDAQKEDVKGSFDSKEKKTINENLDKRDRELKDEIKKDNQRSMRQQQWVKIVGEGAERTASGAGKYFQSDAQKNAAELQAASQIMKDVSSQAQQTEESAKRQATQALEGALQVAGWVLTQVQA